MFQGVILVYDISRRKSYDNMRKWLKFVDEVGFLFLFLICPWITKIHTFVNMYLSEKKVTLGLHWKDSK